MYWKVVFKFKGLNVCVGNCLKWLDLIWGKIYLRVIFLLLVFKIFFIFWKLDLWNNILFL